MSKPGSYTAIAFETGRILGREEAAKILDHLAATWRKPIAFNYRAELRRLAAEIRKTTMNPEIRKEIPEYIDEPLADKEDK